MIGYATEKHKKYWQERKIDWKKSYLDTHNHPHRKMIVSALGQFNWTSLVEVGCGPGANLVNIIRHFPNKQLGGIDINKEAIDLARKTLTGANLKVSSVEDIMMSDNATDVVLSDMCLIYIDPSNIDKVIKEIKRIVRSNIILCEFHHKNWFKRLVFRWKTGYNAYNYKQLLEKHGFYDIRMFKIPPKLWEGGEPQKTFGYLIIAKKPPR